MECLSSAISSVGGNLKDRVIRYLGLHLCCTNYVKEMGKKFKVLKNTKTEVEKKQRSQYARDLEPSSHVDPWLNEFEDVREKVESIPTDGKVFVNMLNFQLQKECSDIIDTLDDLIQQGADIEWPNIKRSLGSYSGPSTSYDVNKNVVTSRQKIFNDVLERLQPNNETQMLALCGMGGVGKSTMMEKLRDAVLRRNTFFKVVRVGIGQKAKPIDIQRKIAEYTGGSLTDTDIQTRADRLHDRFKSFLEHGNKYLVILDDVWDVLNLKDIGLTNPLPKGCKLLLTSRNESVCTSMGVSSIFSIRLLKEPEALNLFWEIAGTSQTDKSDPEIYKIGEDIVKKCEGLPIAIHTVASLLNGNLTKDEWKDMLFSIKNEQLSVFDKTFIVFKKSYDNLKDEEKAVFLLIGLFPDDYDIPTEELMMYGWGLRLFKDMSHISVARRRMNHWVNILIRANLLIESDREGCVKMHDLVNDFILKKCSNDVKQASLVDIDDISKKLTKDSYERILLKCTGMREFPADFNHPNLALLKLLDGYLLRAFPKDFYDGMEKLQVVAYEGIIYQSLLPRRSTTLRTLCLNSWRSMHDTDLSILGDLSNLEVLSLAGVITKLPSAIGKLKKLKLLDLGGCENLRIDDGVFQSLNELEELYMRGGLLYSYMLTEDSCKGLQMLSSKLTALEVDFCKGIIQTKKFSFKKLQRFKISMGCQGGWIDNTGDTASFRNTLKFIVSLQELLESNANELFKKTERLYLSVKDLSSLEHISMHPFHCSFRDLRALVVYDCADLTSIFTVNVASSLTKLECLEVISCPDLKYLVQDETSEVRAIKFHKLKVLKLDDLPSFVSFTDTDDVMELPQLVELQLEELPNVASIFSENNEISATMQPLLKKNAVIPNLEKLMLEDMKNLKEIWSSLEDVKNTSMLRHIEANDCEALVNVFPCNPMRLLGKLPVKNGQPLSLFPNLSSIKLDECKNVKYLFSPLMATHLSNLKEVELSHCDGMEEVVSNGDDNEEMTAPETTTLFPHLDSLELSFLPSLKDGGGGVVKGTKNVIPDQLEYSQGGVVHWSLCQYPRYINVIECPSLSHVIPSHVAGQMVKVEELSINDCNSMKEVCATTHINNSGGLSTHKLPNLKRMHIINCNSLEHILTCSTLESLTKLEEISLRKCKEMKVILKEEEEEAEQPLAPKVVKFPYLKSIELVCLPKLEGFFLGMGEFKWPLLDDVKVMKCPKLVAFTSGKSTAPKLKYINSIFGNYSPEWHNFYVTTNSHQIPVISLEAGILSELNVEDNDAFEEIIASNELLQFQNLEKVRVKNCKCVDAVFKVESEEVSDKELTSKSQTVVKFPKLKEVELEFVPSLKCIWKSNQWTKLEFPNLTRISISNAGSGLEYVLTSSMVGSLMQLQDLHITECECSKVVVKEEEEDDDDDDDSKEEEREIITFPCLKSLKLERLYFLKGFYLGNKEVDVSLPSLTTLVIKNCRNIEIFTDGRVAAPCLKVIETTSGIVNVGREEDINAFIITKKTRGRTF